MRMLCQNLRSGVAAVLALAFLAGGAVAQETGTVTGQVTDATTGQPLAGAQMQVVGTNLGGITNANGRYLITRVPAGEQTVRAVLIGYGQQSIVVEVDAGESAVLNFELTTSAINLEALVVSAVTGREQRARELGTKVANINLDDVNQAPITNIADALGGRSEGVYMQDVNGTTGTSQRIRIRGANSLSLSNEPLVFLDGVQIESGFGGFGVGGQEPSRLNDINPNEIESIEIVKGPAASALYGATAANGVILITTKRGRPGNTEWQFFAEAGEIEDITDYPINYRAYQIDDPNEPLFTESGFFNTAGYSSCPNRSAAAGDCTQDDVLAFNTLEDPRTRPFVTGTRERYGATVRGGNEEVRYFVSGQFEDEGGVIDINELDKVNLRGNLDATLSETADLSVSVGYTDSNLALNSNDNSIFSPILNGLLGQAYFIPADPEKPNEVNDANYGFGFNQTELSNWPNFQEVDRFTMSGNVRYRPTSWLTVNANGGLDLTARHDFSTLQPDRLPIAVSFANGFRESQRTNSYLYTAFVSGVSTFDLTSDLVSTTTAGIQYNKDLSRNTYCFGSSLVPGTASCGTTAALFDVDEDFFEIRTIGAYVQQELAYKDKIFVSGAIRGDDNSAFGADFGIEYYPAASISWVVAEEDWFPRTDWFNNLRVRGAFGVSGLRPGFRDAVTLFNPTTVASEAGDVPGVTLSSTGNTGLEPERTREYEFGFDAAFFQDRLSVDFTYFDKESSDALIDRRLAPSLGLTASVFDNLGSVANKGTELTANLTVLERENIGLSLGFTNTTLDNEILALGEGVNEIPFNRGLQRHQVGYPAGGFWQQPISWDDADGNGLLTNDEVTVADEDEFIGPSLPEWQRSFFADLRLFDFITVSTLFEGRGGHYTGNDSEAFRCGFRSTQGCSAVGNPDASLEEQARYIADRFLGSAAGYVEEADFYRWRELTVAFDMPQSLSDQVSQLDGLRLTLAGRNLALFTDYTGLDPETVEGGGNANFSQSEFNTQPPVRYLMIRLDYTF